MSDLFLRCYRFTMREEGGFVSAAQAARIGDAGSATNFGISLRAVVSLDADKDGKLDFDLDGDGDVDEADIRALDNFPEKRQEFYRDRYWSPVRASEMPWPWCLLSFDAAVNHGPGGAALLLQRAVYVTPDGAFGPKTLAAIRAAAPSMVREFIAQRGVLFARLYAKDTHRPILGWNRRLAQLHDEARGEP